ncbi:winged helix-turn-helix domain-containing protein [Thauera humireducens]|uniref:winged helix-turn-helix domain-containing protein n=1 Tax=Thauera humireducens TaxID=1134435 RepID=UPI00311D73F4
MSSKMSGTMWNQFFQRWAGNGLSLQGQIRQMLVSAILDGQLPLELPIPSSREMAAQLDVARNTVVIAYQQLVDEGYLVSRERKGYFVNPNILAGRVAPPRRRRRRWGIRRSGRAASASGRRCSATSASARTGSAFPIPS